MTIAHEQSAPDEVVVGSDRAWRAVPPLTRARDAVVIVAGVVGLIAVAWLVTAWALHLSVIVFVTGSMSPTMPTGSAAVVQKVAAADLRSGDVVTVTGASSGRPVTHRIVSIDTVAGEPDARSLTLKGDANSIVDAQPYVVEEAPRVLIAAPQLGWLIIWSKSPVVTVVVSMIVAGVVAWGLWPNRRNRAPERTTETKGTSQ